MFQYFQYTLFVFLLLALYLCFVFRSECVFVARCKPIDLRTLAFITSFDLYDVFALCRTRYQLL